MRSCNESALYLFYNMQAKSSQVVFTGFHGAVFLIGGVRKIFIVSSADSNGQTHREVGTQCHGSVHGAGAGAERQTAEGSFPLAVFISRLPNQTGGGLASLNCCTFLRRVRPNPTQGVKFE
jgi:hypothetical protein